LNELDNFFLIKLNITYSGTQWSGYIPTTWDTQNYNYVFDSQSNYAPEVRESDGSLVDPSSYSITFTEESTGGIPRGVKTTITFNQAAQGFNSRYLYYYVPYNELDAVNFFDLALPPSAINDLPSSEYNLAEIAKFLEQPSGSDLPEIGTWPIDEYWDWANYSTSLASARGDTPRDPWRWLQDYVVTPYNLDENTSAFYIAYAISSRIGSNFTFDWDMWKSEYTSAVLGDLGGIEGERLGPEIDEDYVGWMFNRGTTYATNGSQIPDNKWLGGTAAHFATTLCMMLRNMSIPARTVVGYVGANEESAVEAVITALYTHSWVEALIPMDYNLDGRAETAEWVLFDADPRLNGFLPMLPNSGNSVKWYYNISLELLNATSGAPWPSDEVYKDETLNLTVNVFTTSEQGEVKPKEKANVTLGFQEVGESGQLVGEYKEIATNLITDSSGEVSYLFTYDSSAISQFGAGLARLVAYVNNTVVGDSPPYSPGTTINGWNFSRELTWKPFSNPNPLSTLQLEGGQFKAEAAFEPALLHVTSDQIEQANALIVENQAILPKYSSQNANIIEFAPKRKNSSS
ncbi:MAG: transglutaminase-like domain-containing protein, partial [Candidatus Hodarchaeota archaeon]